MRTINDLYEKWNSISPYTGGFLLVSDEHPLSFHIGYLSDSQKCFIVLNTGKLEKISSSKAINVVNILLSDNSYALRFSLNYASLDEIFVKLCWDLMSASKDDQKPIEKIVAQYKKWLRLLQQIGNGLLPPHSQKGLIGELLYLADLIERHGEKKALGEWVGPEGADQDFNFEDGWAEVKTTIIAGTSVQVSSLQQFDRSDEGTLIVYFLDKTSSTGTTTISLNEAVELVSSKVTMQSNKGFLELKLAKCGYQSKNADEYSAYRFKLSERRQYCVSSGFPRLTKDNVPPAVIEAQYRIDLPSIETFRKRED